MISSMTLPSKILKTKKRLSDDRWLAVVPVIVATFIAVFCVYAFRVITVSWSFGAISGDIPVVSMPIDDPGYKRFIEEPAGDIEAATPAVVLTTEAFYFGTLKAFTVDFADVRNKYMISHIDGQPQLGSLRLALINWMATQKMKNTVVVLSPTGEIPLPIVLQVMAGLKGEKMFKRVVLAGGIQ